MSERTKISPELSAQGVRKKPNPMLRRSWKALKGAGLISRGNSLLVDYGCGHLRNVATLLSFSSRLILVDTARQLKMPHDFYGTKKLARDFAKKRWPKAKLRLLTTAEFERSRFLADVIFIVNVFDVVPNRVRRGMIGTALRHLKLSGSLVLIVPRNDAWTLRLCVAKRAFQDGFVLKHPRGHTFYKNWRGDTLKSWVSSRGVAIVRDLSCYRQVCLICRAMS